MKRSLWIALWFCGVVVAGVCASIWISGNNTPSSQIVAPVVYYSGTVVDLADTEIPGTGLRVARVVMERKGVADEYYDVVAEKWFAVSIGNTIHFTLVPVNEKTWFRGSTTISVGFYLPPDSLLKMLGRGAIPAK